MAETRGVLYVKWGHSHDGLLRRSMESLRAVHPELPVHVHELPDSSTLLDKSRMLDFAPFAQTLYLDTDTVVLDRLDFGFERAERFGLACSVCECPWARRYTGLRGELVEYNTGVLFFNRKAEPVFRLWESLVGQVDSSMTLADGKSFPCNDQAAFAVAVERSEFLPFVLPYNWNFRPNHYRSFFGPIKIWHDPAEVPPGLIEWNRDQLAPGSAIKFCVLT
jgi:hypothetical protein